MPDYAVPDFSEFSRESTNLSGDKIPFQRVLNQPVILRAFRFIPSKVFPGARCAQMQLDIDGCEYVTFTTSGVLCRQLDEYKGHLPFRTTIQKVRNYYTMT